MPNHPKAWPLLELSEHLAASLVAFSGERPTGEFPASNDVAFETTVDMLKSGFVPSYGLTTIAGLTAQGEPSIDELRRNELFDPAFRGAIAVLCLYMHALAEGALSRADCDQFDNGLQSSIARLCAGQFGFDVEPSRTFEGMQQLIKKLLSETWINGQSPGNNDCIGNLLGYLSRSRGSGMQYAFVVGSENQSLGCGASFIRAMRMARTLFAA